MFFTIFFYKLLLSDESKNFASDPYSEALSQWQDMQEQPGTNLSKLEKS